LKKNLSAISGLFYGLKDYYYDTKDKEGSRYGQWTTQFERQIKVVLDNITELNEEREVPTEDRSEKQTLGWQRNSNLQQLLLKSFFPF